MSHIKHMIDKASAKYKNNSPPGSGRIGPTATSAPAAHMQIAPRANVIITGLLPSY